MRSGSYDWKVARECRKDAHGEEANGFQAQAEKGLKSIFKTCERLAKVLGKARVLGFNKMRKNVKEVLWAGGMAGFRGVRPGVLTGKALMATTKGSLGRF